MKKKMVVFYSLMFLPLAVVLIALQFLPELIPAHYDMNNQVARWGSKYETLIFPVITILFGYFMLAMAKLSSKQEENGSNNKNVCIVTGIASLALFNAMTVYFLYADFNSIENLSSIALDLNQLVFGLLGVAMIILGNIMPKLRMNSVIGLRSVWSMKNETTWKKGQRFGGISFIVSGIIIIMVCFLTKGISCFGWTMSIVAILLIVDTYYTYTLSKKILMPQSVIHKIPLPRDAPKVNIEERTIWDEKTMLAALQTIENPALHLAVHMNMILSLREGEILGLQPSDLDFDAADGRGTISVNKTMQRANKDALEKLDPKQVYYTFPDRREGSKSSLILKKPKTKKSTRILYMTKPLKEELLAWLEKLKQDEQSAPQKYSNCGQLFRLPDGLPIAPELLTKWYRLWRAEHSEFEQIVFHGLRHSSATYQLLQSDGDFKSVQGNTGHATASVLMDTYAHTQDKPRLELTEKIEANFYSQDLTPAAPQPRQNEKPVATKISGKEILEAIRLMDADERRELTRALFA